MHGSYEQSLIITGQSFSVTSKGCCEYLDFAGAQVPGLDGRCVYDGLFNGRLTHVQATGAATVGMQHRIWFTSQPMDIVLDSVDYSHKTLVISITITVNY